MNKNQYPSLYAKEPPKIKPQKTIPNFQIPTATLNDELKPTKRQEIKKHATIFGFSQENFENVKREITKISKIKNYELGKNWIHLSLENEEFLGDLMKMNRGFVGGEMIGVHLWVGESVKKDVILRRGWFKSFLEYFFG